MTVIRVITVLLRLFEGEPPVVFDLKIRAIVYVEAAFNFNFAKPKAAILRWRKTVHIWFRSPSLQK